MSTDNIFGLMLYFGGIELASRVLLGLDGWKTETDDSCQFYIEEQTKYLQNTQYFLLS